MEKRDRPMEEKQEERNIGRERGMWKKRKVWRKEGQGEKGRKEKGM